MRLRRVVNDVFKQFDFGSREREFGSGQWRRAAEHADPEYAPGQDAEDRDQVR